MRRGATLRRGARADEYEREFDRRQGQFHIHKERLEDRMRQRQEGQLQRLKRLAQVEEDEAAASSPQVTALRRKQATLLNSRNYSEAFEHMKLIRRAEQEALESNQGARRAEMSRRLKSLVDEHQREREFFREKARVEDQALTDFKYSRLTQLVTMPHQDGVDAPGGGAVLPPAASHRGAGAGPSPAGSFALGPPPPAPPSLAPTAQAQAPAQALVAHSPATAFALVPRAVADERAYETPKAAAVPAGGGGTTD